MPLPEMLSDLSPPAALGILEDRSSAFRGLDGATGYVWLEESGIGGTVAPLESRS